MEPSPFRTNRENEGPLFGLVLIRGSKAWPSYLCRRRLVHSFGGRFHMTPCPLQKIRCGCMSFVQLAQTRRGCLASFWIALVCRMWANHCLEVVLVSASASCCRLSVQHSSLPACRGLRFAFGSAVALLFFLIFNPLACRVSRTSILLFLCLCRRTRIQQSSRHSLATVKNDRSAIVVCRRCQLAATSLEVSRTLIHLGSPHAAVLLLGISGAAH